VARVRAPPESALRLAPVPYMAVRNGLMVIWYAPGKPVPASEDDDSKNVVEFCGKTLEHSHVKWSLGTRSAFQQPFGERHQDAMLHLDGYRRV
jgi:hypothetical protein